MKLSVSLSASEVALLDHIVKQEGLKSRSAAIQRAIRAFARPDLIDQYTAAFAEWDASEDAKLWDSTSGDGIVEHAQ